MIDYHAADCGVPSVNRNVKLNFSSTLEGAVLILTCDNYLTSNTNATDQQSLTVICQSNTTSWNSDPADFIESCSSVTTTTTTTLTGTYIIYTE